MSEINGENGLSAHWVCEDEKGGECSGYWVLKKNEGMNGDGYVRI